MKITGDLVRAMNPAYAELNLDPARIEEVVDVLVGRPEGSAELAQCFHAVFPTTERGTDRAGSPEQRAGLALGHTNALLQCDVSPLFEVEVDLLPVDEFEHDGAEHPQTVPGRVVVGGGEHVHGQGSRYGVPELLIRATGRPLDPDAFLGHLRRRYLDG